MPESVKIVEAQGQETYLSVRLFDSLMGPALAGTDVGVSVEWAGTEDEDGQPSTYPIVTVDGVAALDFVRGLMEPATYDDKLIMDTGLAFEKKVAVEWDSTIEFYKHLDELAPLMDELAVDPRAGFFTAMREKFSDSKNVRVTDESIAGLARLQACVEFQGWALAVQSEELEPFDQEAH